MKDFTNTWRLVRLVLRRDRVKLPIWIAAISALVAASVPALKSTYGSFETQLVYVSNVATSAIGRAFGGVPDGPSLGAVTMIEMFAFTSVLIAFMNTTLVVRHTRANEESGSAELIGSGIVGRYSSLTAVMLVALASNLLIGLILAAIISGVEDFSVTASVSFGMAIAFVGFIFASIAAVASQVASSARAANGMATMAIAGAFLLRAIGDGFATVNPDGLSAVSAWPSWLSPIGLGFQIFPLTQQNWWIFGILIAIIAVLIGLAYYLLAIRDNGLGLVAERKGPAQAPKGLLSVFGLSWRLQKGTLFWWALFFWIFGMIFGGMANDFKDIFDEVGDEIPLFSGSDDITSLFFGVMISMAGVLGTGYALMALLKMRSEEAFGRLESVFSTAVDRSKWMLTNMTIAFMGVILLMIVITLSAALLFNITGGEGLNVGELVQHGLIQIPAMLSFAGISIFAFGFFPRMTTAITWGMFIIAFVLLQFGLLLELPQWILNASPFSHVPQIVGEVIDWKPILVLLGIGSGLGIAGILRFRQRDLDLK